MIVRLLIVGDVVGITGCAMFQKHIPALREKYAIDGLIVNGENTADGRGITPRNMQFYKHCGVDVVTSGNHIWDKKDIYPYLAEHRDLLRPANFARENPGVGVTTFTCKGVPIGVINVQGRVFMREHLECPFRTTDSLLTYLRDKTKVIVVDFHAETTSETGALGWYLDGRVSAVVGTHTHVQTADERLLPQGTAFITDLGMVGAHNSMLGMKKEPIINQFLTQMPTRYSVETSGPALLCGIVVEIDSNTGRAQRIERIRLLDENLHVDTASGDGI